MLGRHLCTQRQKGAWQQGGMQWTRDSTHRRHTHLIMYLSFQLIIQICLCQLGLTD